MSFVRTSAIIAAVLPALAVAQGTTPPKLDAACEDVVLFWARGNDAPYHDGRTSPLIDATCSKLASQSTSCDYIDIQFDATYGADFCTQIAEGARNGISQITAFNAKCPNTKIVVNGYSQGAQVAGDVLGGPGGCSKVSDGLDSNSAAGKAIAAALLWGDVRHTANQPYNTLSGAGMQKYPREGNDLALLNRYSNVLRSYCAAGDPVCAGGNVVADHLNYFELYTDEASSWIVSMVNKVLPSTSATPSSTPTPSSSQAPTSVPTTLSTVTPSGSQAPPASTGASSAPTGGAGYGTVPKPSGTGPKPSDSAPSSYGTAPKPSGTPAPYPTVPAPSGSAPVYSKHHGTHPPFPKATPYDNCVVTYEVVTVYA